MDKKDEKKEEQEIKPERMDHLEKGADSGKQKDKENK